MKTLLLCFVFLSYCFLVGCNNEKTLEEIDPLVIEPNLCDSSGVLKTKLYAEVWVGSVSGWTVVIADSARIAEFGGWLPFLCPSLPDSLWQNGLELVISYLDKSRVLDDQGLISIAELLSIKRISDFPEEDPRNGENMSTFYLMDNEGKNVLIDKGLVFRNENEWNEFLDSQPGAIPSRKVDFEKYTLVAQAVRHGGCGWIYKRSFGEIGPHEYKYKISAEIYGGCQVLITKFHWVTVPKISETDIVVFEFEEKFP
ncbi:MAG: hypothetical protein AABY93_00850 [Bacteroidota bacterium]